MSIPLQKKNTSSISNQIIDKTIKEKLPLNFGTQKLGPPLQSLLDTGQLNIALFFSKLFKKMKEKSHRNRKPKK